MSSDSDSHSPQLFPLAHPPPKSPQCLRLRPRLVLQIQQLAPSTSRAIPILDIFQPSRLGKSVALVPDKLSPHDLYITQTEPYAHLATTPSPDSNNNNIIIAAIANRPRNPKQANRDVASAVLYFPVGGHVWDVYRVERGYRFVLRGEDATGVTRVLEWERRSRESERGARFVLWENNTTTTSTVRSMESMGSMGQEEDRRRGSLATLTQKGFKLSGWDRGQREHWTSGMDTTDEEIDRCLCEWALVMGVYVAAQEGWI